jgi:branched-chain amino acid transport system substrate-binding protein
MLTTNGNSNRAILKQIATLLPRDLYFPDSITELKLPEIADLRARRAVETFRAAMSAVGIPQPDVPNAAGWDAGRLVVDALRKLGPDATPGQIRDYLAGVKDWVGIRGAYDFRAVPQRGLSQSAVVLVRWDGVAGEWVVASKPGGLPLPAAR